MPQDKTGTDHASSPTAVQILSPVPADHPQSRAATQGSVSEEQLKRAVQATGLEIGAHSCQAEPQICADENSPNYELRSLQSSGSLTGSPPARARSSDGEMVMAGTVSELTSATVDINGRRNSTSSPSPDCQDSEEAGSVTLHPPETKGLNRRLTMDHENPESELKFVSTDVRRHVGGNEPLSSTAVPPFRVHRPADYVQHAGQNEQPQKPGLAVQSSGEISNEGPRNQVLACVTATVPSTCTDDIHISAELAPQPMPKKTHAYSRRTRTGCITCRRRRRKCDEQRPSCTWIYFTRLRNKGMSYP